MASLHIKSLVDTLIHVINNSDRKLKSKNYYHGAMLVSGGKIYSKCTNSSERTTFGGIITPCIHAEMNCIIKGIPHNNKGRKKYNIFVVRMGNNNNIIDSKPCRICINMMKKYNIKKYTILPILVIFKK